jgi:hypothetical protein
MSSRNDLTLDKPAQAVFKGIRESRSEVVMRLLSRPSVGVPTVVCVLFFVARAAVAQVVPSGPVYYTPATTAQTVYYFPQPPVSPPAASAPQVTPVAMPLYSVPIYPPSYQTRFYPTYAVTEGPIQTFFRRLLEPLSAPAPVAAARAVNVVPAAPWASGYIPPAAATPAVYYPAPTVVQRPVVDSPVTYAASPPPAPTACSCAASDPRATSPFPSAAATGSTFYPPFPAGQRSERVPLEEKPHETKAPPVLPYHLEYNEHRPRLPDNASQTGQLSAVPATHRQELNATSGGNLAAGWPASAVRERLDDSGWRAVP